MSSGVRTKFESRLSGSKVLAIWRWRHPPKDHRSLGEGFFSLATSNALMGDPISHDPREQGPVPLSVAPGTGPWLSPSNRGTEIEGRSLVGSRKPKVPGWHPSGVRGKSGRGVPVVSLRSTPGYKLRCLRHRSKVRPEMGRFAGDRGLRRMLRHPSGGWTWDIFEGAR